MTLLYPLLAVLIWAGNTIVSKAAAGVFDPAAISFYRWLLAWLALSPFCLGLLWRQRRLLRPHWPKLAALALLGMVMYQCLAYYAAHETSATNMGVICALIPLLGALINGLLFRQPIAPLTLLGIAVSLSGVLYLLGQGQPVRLLQAGINHGDALMLVASASYALYGILLKRWALPFGSWLLLYAQALLAVLMLTPLALTASTLAIPRAGIGLLLFAGLGSSVFAAYLWMRGIQQLGSERCAVFLNLLPLFTALLASGMLGETIQAHHWLGGGLILAGVLLAQNPLRLLPWRRLALKE